MVVYKPVANGTVLGRIRRKKCDETRPICGRCRRDPAAACAWADTMHKDVPCLSERVSASQKHQTISATPQLSLASYLGSFKSSSPSSDQIDLLVHTFNAAYCVSFVDPRQSIVTQGIPYAIHQPGLMHAYAACGAAILSQGDGKWKPVSLLHYNRAIQSVSEALTPLGIDHARDAEWLLAAINMLHIFEVSLLYTSLASNNSMFLTCLRPCVMTDIVQIPCT